MRKAMVMMAAAVLAMGFAPRAAAQGTIQGTVRAVDGAPIAGATVTAEGPDKRHTVTDDAGRYRLVALPAGEYQVSARAMGYIGARLRVAAGSRGMSDLVLSPSPITLAPLEVSATIRAGTGTSAAALPVKVDVIEERQLLQQQGMVTSPTELLANLIPSFSPSRQKLSGAGESFRGRRPLFLIDGIPQSNPLRDGRRDGFTIDMEAIERVEVVFGANAIQGLGATGGIVNYVTVSAPASGRLEQRMSVGTTSSGEFGGDGTGWRAHYLAGKRLGSFDVLGSVSFEQRGLQYDGSGRPIGIDNVQGDVADSRSRNFFAKVGWQPTGAQRLQLMVNDFRLAQRGNFDMIPGDRAAGTPTISVEGDPEGVEPMNDATTIGFDYEHRAIAGGSLSFKAYYQDFAALFGGGRFDSFQDPEIAPVGELFDQSENNSEKIGTRLTYVREDVAGVPLGAIAGFDFLRDQTFQRLVNTDRNWVPVTNFRNYAPFLQLDYDAASWLTLSGGVRWEIAKLDVPTFTTLAGNRSDFQRLSVEGGSPGFDEPLLNVGAVVTPLAGLRFYGTISQAYTMPDVGRVLRGVSEPGTRVDEYLALTPIKTDNREIGGTYGTAYAQVGLTYFESESDMGSRLVPNSDGIFEVRREPTLTSGWEATAKVAPHRHLLLGAGYSALEGRFDSDDDGDMDSDLGAADIGPNRLNLSADLLDLGRFRGRLQLNEYLDRDFDDAAGAVTASFDGYRTVDASLSVDLAISTLTLSAANLFDEQYITYYGQAATDRDDRYFAGRGRTLTLRLETRF